MNKNNIKIVEDGYFKEIFAGNIRIGRMEKYAPQKEIDRIINIFYGKTNL